MIRWNRVGAAAFAALLGAFSTSAASALTYDFQNIRAPYSPGYTVVTGISNSGAVVGQYLSSGGASTGVFVYESGAFTNIPAPDEYPRRYAYGINAVGAVIGEAAPQNGPYRAALYENGEYSYYLPPAATVGASGTAINDAGVIVGTYGTTGGHGFLYDGSFTTIDHPLAQFNTQLTSINNHNDVVGYYDLPGRRYSFLYSGGAFTDLVAPWAYEGIYATGINDKGEIVGNYFYQSQEYGFHLYDGVWSMIENQSGVVPLHVAGINNAGQIAGFYSVGREELGFIAAQVHSVPEPSTWTLLLIGFGSAGACLRSSRRQALDRA